MASFVLRRIDPALWTKVRAKCRSAGLNVVDLVERLLTHWLEENV